MNLAPHPGTLTEISGPAGGGKTQVVVQELAALLAGNASEDPARVAWIESGFSIYPPALESYGIDLEQVVWVDAGDDPKRVLWAAQQVVNSQIFSAVVIAGAGSLETVQLRRLQLVAEKARARVLILSDFPTTEGSWPLHLQIQVNRVQGLRPETLGARSPVEVQILKRRGTPLNPSQGEAKILCPETLKKKIVSRVFCCPEVNGMEQQAVS